MCCCVYTYVYIYTHIHTNQEVSLWWKYDYGKYQIAKYYYNSCVRLCMCCMYTCIYIHTYVNKLWRIIMMEVWLWEVSNCEVLHQSCVCLCMCAVCIHMYRYIYIHTYINWEVSLLEVLSRFYHLSRILWVQAQIYSG